MKGSGASLVGQAHLGSVRSGSPRWRRLLSTASPPPLLVGVAAVALAAFTWRIGRPAFWLDEVATVQDASKPLPELLAFLRQRDAGLGPYYLAMHVWLRFGEAEWWARLPSALAMVVAVVAATDVARRHAGQWAGLLAGFLLVLSPAATRYAHEARPYAFAIAFAVLAVWVLDHLDGRRRWWAVYSGTVALLGLSHVVGLVTLVAHPLFVWASGDRRFGRWLVAAGVGVLPPAVVGWFAFQARSTVAWIPKPDLERVRLAFAEIVGGWEYLTLLGALAVVAVVRTRDRWTAGLVVWFAVPPLLLALVGLVTPLFLARYLVVCTPALVLLAATAVRAPWQVAAGVVAAAVVAATVIAWPEHQRLRLPYGHGPDYRAAARAIAADCTGGVAGRHSLAAVRTMPYYVEREGCELPWLSGAVPAHVDRIWVVQWDWDRSEPTPGPGATVFRMVDDVTVPGLRLTLWRR
ncbi:glycosyltransferase family 39 protein [Thermasporomyces composti]|uniref:glycosyltransferase family 39 protein n=1 Tax=Thermasporomyces composti TaxID=696763 RepID=UPI000E266F04|nr:glycosyltransferase family 39 protein [Thermasporomyces composti]